MNQKPFALAFLAFFLASCIAGICEEGCGGSCSGNCAGNCGGKKAESSQARFTAPTLLALIRAKSPLVILDCRDDKVDDGKRIPTAKKISPKPPSDQLAKLLPKKDILIVVYDDKKEPEARLEVAELLRKEGYENIIDFPSGIIEWEKAGNPIEKDPTFSAKPQPQK